MALEKYKVCPACGEHNAPTLLECRKCETDLTGVKIVDATAAQPDPATPETHSEATGTEELFRVCDCGEMNPPQARKCQACGEDISDILPTKHCAPPAKSFSYTLESVDGSYSSTFEEPVVVLGREALLAENLRGKPYVSRQQAKLTIVAGKVFIENLSKTNKTFINNADAEDGSPVALNDGDEIGLGGKVIDGVRQDQAAYFIFRCQT